MVKGSIARVLVPVVAALLCLRCGGDSPTSPSGSGGSVTPPPPATAYVVSSFVIGVTSSSGAAGTLRSGGVPQASGGPSVQPAANASVINGGSTQTRLQSAAAFQTVYVSVANVSGGVDGYWEVRLPASVTDTTLIVNLARALPVSAFDLAYGAANAAGVAGASAPIQSRVVQASTGSVQVSVSWNAPSDVDLHVIDPRGEEVYYGHDTSASGGELDLDSNAGCSIDGTNNENIRWPAGRAPSGTYTVRLDYWSACDVAGTDYVVTVNNGVGTQTFTGRFTGSGDRGGAGSGQLITTFNFAGGALTPQGGFDVFSALSRFRTPASPAAIEKRRLATGSR